MSGNDELPPKSKVLSLSENEVNGYIKKFQLAVKNAKDAHAKLLALMKLIENEKIDERIYKPVMKELIEHFSSFINETFIMKRKLEEAMIRAKIELAIRGGDNLTIENIISKINSALASLSIEEEASIIEQYLTLIMENASIREESGQIKRSLSICRERLKIISDKWASIRRRYIEQIMNLELKASQIRDNIEEIKVRFKIGEIDERSFEREMGYWQGRLKKIKKEISDIRKHVDDMDVKLFKCMEVLGEKYEE